MTMHDGIRDEAIDEATAPALPQTPTPTVPMSGRIWARMFAARYDQQVEEGVRALAGTPLAAHYARLASRGERQDVAQSLASLLRDANPDSRGIRPTARVPIRADAVRESADIVEGVLARLLGPLPVRARGLARLRILLADGRGPVYRVGTGTLAAAMRGVLAAM